MKAVTTIFTVATLAASVIACDGGYYDEDLKQFVSMSNQQAQKTLVDLPPPYCPGTDVLVEGSGKTKVSCSPRAVKEGKCEGFKTRAAKVASDRCRAGIGKKWQVQFNICNAQGGVLSPSKAEVMNACTGDVTLVGGGWGGADRYEAIFEGASYVRCSCSAQEPSQLN